MGYYDNQSPLKSQPPRWPLGLLALLCSIAGAIVAILLLPLLSKTGLIPALQANAPLLNERSGQTQISSVKVNTNITEAVSRAQPAVVGILSYQAEDPLNFNEARQGAGSGIIVRKANGKAFVVTNFHVINNSSELKVVLNYGNKTQTVGAKVRGYDKKSDLALLEIDDTYVKVIATLGDSDVLRSGEPAIAIGNPLGLGQSVTVGVISHPLRTIRNGKETADVIQTDAAINPGNSGGALLNGLGQVVGINTLKIIDEQRKAEGLGFAIPIKYAMPIINKIAQYGYVPRPVIGIATVDLEQVSRDLWKDLQIPSQVETGVVIREVMRPTPASQAKLQPRDLIVALDNTPIANSSELQRYIYSHKNAGQKLNITYYRAGKKESVSLTLGQAPRE